MNTTSPCRRASERIKSADIDPGRESCFIPDFESAGEWLIEDVSKGGLSVRMQSGEAQRPAVGTVLKGILRLGGCFDVAIRCVVVHSGPKRLGLSFNEPSAKVANLIRAYFHAEYLGVALKPSSAGADGLRFSDESGNWLEMHSPGGELRELQGELPALHLKIHWSGPGSRLEVEPDGAAGAPTPESERGVLLRVLANLPTLNSAERASLSALLALS